MITTSHLVTMNDRVGSRRSVCFKPYLTEIARILPLAGADPLSVRPPSEGAARIQDVPLPPPLAFEVDVLELLREERQAER